MFTLLYCILSLYSFPLPGISWATLFDISADINCPLSFPHIDIRQHCSALWMIAVTQGPSLAESKPPHSDPPSIWGYQSVNSLAVLLPCEWHRMGCWMKSVGLSVTTPDRGLTFGMMGVGHRREYTHSCPFLRYVPNTGHFLVKSPGGKGNSRSGSLEK